MATAAQARCVVSASRLSVLLTTEGTYPFSSGGVSTWCDILCRALGDIEFVLFAVTGNPEVELKYDLPDNISDTTDYTGATQVQGGTFILPPTLGTDAVTVSSGATLIAGITRPGNDDGPTVDGPITIRTGATLIADEFSRGDIGRNDAITLWEKSACIPSPRDTRASGHWTENTKSEPPSGAAAVIFLPTSPRNAGSAAVRPTTMATYCLPSTM